MPSNSEQTQGRSIDALIGRLRCLEDAEAIRDLFFTYGAYLDTKNWVPYASLFTSDGDFIAPIGVAKGPDAIQTLFADRLKNVDSGTHLITNLCADVTGDQARATVLWTYVARDQQGMPTLTQNGTYESRLVYREGQWKFQRHEITRTNGVAPYQR